MKTDVTIHAANTATTSMYPSIPVSLEEKNNSSLTSALNIDPTVAASTKYSRSINDQWNSMKPLSRNGEPAAESSDDIKTVMKIINTIEPSFASLVVAFMVMSLNLFANIQKANMDMSLNELTFIKLDMKRQISEMKEEQKANFIKDMVMGAIEAASALVQFISSAHTTSQLRGKIVEQDTVFGQTNAQSAKKSSENLIEPAKNRTDSVEILSKDDNVTPQLKANAETETTNIKKVLDKAEVAKANADAAVGPDLTPEQIKFKTDKINSEVAFINARQQAFSGLGAVVKAMSPFVQGSLGRDATTHQIAAKEAENAKDIRNSLYRQYTDWAAGFRDGLTKLLATLEDVQKQDAENSLASSRKMA